MKIGILGTRGIPNFYGGYEQITEYIAAGLVEHGHEVTVYNSHQHPFKENSWNGVQIKHCFDAEKTIGTAGQFVYDFNCIQDARKQNFDLILFMGYTSSSVWYRFFPRKSVIVSNMDGLEWKRKKYNTLTRKFLKYAEALAVHHSDFHIADSVAIQKYLSANYGIQSAFIPYGADTMHEYLGPTEKKHCMLMARMEPENNIEMILTGFRETHSNQKCLVVGNYSNKYGKHIRNKFSKDARIEFLGGVFDKIQVHTLRRNASIYFHGHSVGGTNPSLLEAMADGVTIAAHDNEFNRAVLENDAYYFRSADDVSEIIENKPQNQSFAKNNLRKIKTEFSKEKIIDAYNSFLIDCYKSKLK